MGEQNKRPPAAYTNWLTMYAHSIHNGLAMILSEYLEKHEPTVVAFAQKVGVKRGAIYSWLNGKKTPDPVTMQRIFAATNGLVTPNDLLGIDTDGITEASASEGGVYES